MRGAIHKVAVLILIAVLIASTLLILYTKNIIRPPTGEIEEKPAEKPIVEEKPKGIRGDRFGFVCFDEEALEDLNLGWVRPHPGPFIWGHIEPEEGRYDFSEADEVVRRAQEMGLNILATIWPYANWDQERWRDIERFVMEDFPELPRSRYKPYDMEAYKRFVRTLVERYDGDGVDDMPGLERPIKYWEVLNEPSTGVKARMRDKAKAFFMGDAEDYFEILKATYEAVKEADPEAKVLNGGMIPLPPPDDPFYKFWGRVFELGGAEYIDILNFHALSKMLAESIPLLRESFGEYIEGKPIWVTEFSAEEAELYVEAAKVFAEGVERIFLTAYKAEPSMPEDLIVGSLIDFDGNLKPSYYAVKTMVMLLGNFEEAERLNPKTYRFRAGYLTIYLLWGGAPKTLSGEVLKVTMLGEAEMVRVEELRPEEEPYYLVVGSREELEELQSRLGEIAPAGGVAVRTVGEGIEGAWAIHFGCWGHKHDEYAYVVGYGWMKPHPGPFNRLFIEPRRGEYDFSTVDEGVRRALEKGAEVVATIWPYAEWDEEAYKGVEGYGMATGDGPFAEVLPSTRFKPHDMEAYKAFVKALVERYDGDGIDDMPGLERPIKYWEILNEPESQSVEEDGRIKCFFQGGGSDYYELLKATYEAIKETDPEAVVIIGGLATLQGEKAEEFLREVLELGGGEYFDIAAVHSYDDEMDDFNVGELKALLKEYGLEKPIWVTEVGPKPEMTREDDIAFVKAAIRAFAEGAEVLFFDHDPGVVMAYILGDFNSVERLSEGLYRFDIGGETVYVIWSPATLPKELSGPLYVIHIYGEVEEKDASEVEVSGEPIYVTASSRIAERVKKAPAGIALPPPGEKKEGKPQEGEEGKVGVPLRPLEGYKLEDSRFGILQQYLRKDPRTLELGAVWDRPAGPGDTSFRWGVVERERGEYDWSEPDSWVRWCGENGRIPIGMIFPYAEWDQVEGYGKYGEKAPHNLEAYREFVKALVERYDGDGVDDMPGLTQPVKYWEVMNEVVPRPWGEHGEVFGFFDGTAEEYFEILRVTAEAIREADPEAKILNAGIADMTIGNECKEFYSKVFELGGAEYFDIANIHWLYNLEEFKRFLSSHGVEKPIWITETEFMLETLGTHYVEAESAVWGIVEALGSGVERIILCPGEAAMEGEGYNALKTLIHTLSYYDEVERIGEGCLKFTGKYGVTYVVRDAAIPDEALERIGEMNIFDVEGKPIELKGEYVEGLIYISDLSPPSIEESEKPLEEKPPKGEGRVNILFTGSEYKAAERLGDGVFETGQEADIVLSWFDFNYSGGPLCFNHPMDIASDGRHLLLADTRNNRILIWNHLPTGNEPPDVVLGQPNFEANAPGTSRSRLRWPVSVATDGEHIIVADTYNNRVLIWNRFPERNGTPADIVLGQENFDEWRVGSIAWPWDVWTDGRRLMVASTMGGCILIWNSFPMENNQPPDLILSIEDFGTPRNIESDGETYLLIGDHNAKMAPRGGNFLWLGIPEKGDEPYDAYIGGEVLWCSEVIDGDLFAIANNQPLYIEELKSLRGELDLHEMEESGVATIFKNLFLEDGDGSGAVYVDNGTLQVTYISLYNGGRIVGYFGRPEDREPDFAIGSDDVMRNPFTDTYYFTDGGRPISDGRSLILLAGYNRRVMVWRRIPDESGAKPDIIYELPFEPTGGDLYGGKLYVVGRGGEGGGLAIWENITRGEEPETLITRELAGIDLSEARDITFDDDYAYLIAGGALYIFRQPFTPDSTPIKTLTLEEEFRSIHSNGEKLAAICGSRVLLIDVNSLMNEEPRMVELQYHFNLPEDVFIDDHRLFVADTVFNRVLIWEKLPERGDEKPDVVLGQDSFEPDLPPSYTRRGLFWPGAVWFDGHFLWVGEYKFSNRILRYS